MPQESEIYWTACYTLPGAEHEARDGIQDIGFGTFVPTFAKCWYRDGKLCASEHPLLTRYVLVALAEGDESWGKINDVDGIHKLLTNVGKPIRINDRDVSRLMLAHATGVFNVVQTRNAAGQFALRASSPPKHKERRSRPLSGPKSPRALRRYLRRVNTLRNHTDTTNQVA